MTTRPNVASWDSAYAAALKWAIDHPGQAYTLTISNHHIGPRHFEMRICVRDPQGLILTTAIAKRSSRYIRADIENWICHNLDEALGLRGTGRSRIYGEPEVTTATFPLWFEDPRTWQTELPAAS